MFPKYSKRKKVFFLLIKWTLRRFVTKPDGMLQFLKDLKASRRDTYTTVSNIARYNAYTICKIGKEKVSLENLESFRVLDPYYTLQTHCLEVMQEHNAHVGEKKRKKFNELVDRMDRHPLLHCMADLVNIRYSECPECGFEKSEHSQMCHSCLLKARLI